uniref:Nucleoside phosphorylase domain-containing protein n=1 Tax=Strombidium rassoulzadegani TaxID=1082188 RepID=A0A7S3CJ40_9SPIT|mmetsp:Transcript_12734/g.21469  ORF Transcript_12734/g.21469 Transcript_12734/m.21469 type:complete len:230 (+) Transcript_12734:370-1059(+)
MGLPEEDIISVGIHKRYVLYLVGPVLICSHGMGGPSTSILLHEVAKLLKYANADAQWIRMGTSGGIGVEEGSLVVTKQPLNSDLEPFHESIILGERVRRATNFDQELCSKLYHAAKKAAKAKVEIGLTISCYDFYEGQLRSDGAICEFSEAEKKAFLEDIQKKGVRNMEMDSVQFGAFCNTIGVRAGMMCVTLVNRFERDQISDDPQVLDDYEQRLIDSMIVFITDNIK